MSLIRTAAATALGAALSAKVQLAQAPTVVSAPPSERAKYPALAILLDKADLAFSVDEDVEVNSSLGPGQPGYVLEGTYRTDALDSYVAGDVWVAPGGKVTLSHMGTIRCQGRIWVGTRNPTQREQIENDVWLAFQAERAAPGRLQVSVAGVELAGIVIPFGIATATVSSSEWTGEQAFTERLWTYLAFDLDVPLLVPRTDPLAKTLTLAITRDLSAAILVPSDLTTKLPDLEEFTVDSDGNATETL